ncbi:unnamed protein product [Larinioides sclopetarius]|uniref:Uncharacterized protein n=1 Tax=Larinioides sclopetarius TaxID=280406 RepID=A0AAV1Z826_9ARAC
MRNTGSHHIRKFGNHYIHVYTKI